MRVYANRLAAAGRPEKYRETGAVDEAELSQVQDQRPMRLTIAERRECLLEQSGVREVELAAEPHYRAVRAIIDLHDQLRTGAVAYR